MLKSVAFTALATVLAMPSAHAATHLALDRFDPAPAGDSFFGVDAPNTPQDLRLSGRLLLDWGHDPLVLRSAIDNHRVQTLVADQLFGYAGFGFELGRRLTLSVDLPVAIAQSGPDQNYDVPQPAGTHVGDLRLGARVRLFTLHPLFNVSVGGFAYGPFGHATSTSGAYVSDGAWRGRAELLLHGKSDRYVWSFTVGPDLRASQSFTSVAQGTMLRSAAAFAMRFLQDRNLQVGPEVVSGFTLRDVTKRNDNVEALLGARYYAHNGIEAGVGAGPGFSAGVGTPTVRVVATFGYNFNRSEPPPPPPVVETPPPPPPVVPPAPIPEPPPVVEEPAPPPEPPAPPPPEPEQAKVVGNQIVILDQIKFATAKASIKAESEATLQAIATAISSLPADARLRIEGHTDNRGDAKRNQRLSEARAKAVVKWLVKHGFAASRFEARGFGATQPIASNDDETGRLANRRVEIRVIQ